jgi:aminopeptidase N
MKIKHIISLSFFIFFNVTISLCQLFHTTQDSLRGSITEERSWWDVKKYDLEIEPIFNKKKMTGVNTITFFTLGRGQKMQVDMQEPMVIDSITFSEEKTTFSRLGNVYYINFENELLADKMYQITIHFSGKPRKAVNAPWDGGWIWSKDVNGNPWMTVACQGLGASSWYPCKDHQSDEPDLGANISVKVPAELVAVSNGKFIGKKEVENNKVIYYWEVKNPINSYNIVPYIGKYVHWSDEYTGEKGKLSLDYWVLEGNLDRSKKQFEQVKSMLTCLEKWFGPYPFYEDGYKLVESPHLGMEHQSAIAYGNKYKNGYDGSDISHSGTGDKWDFIIEHESGHEWFGNSITSNDIADMWIHEAFTSYSEVLYTESLFGKEAANNYIIGIRNRINNDTPIIGAYGVNKEGSGDMYFKGSNLIHIIRQLMNDDEEFRNLLRAINKKFYHQTVTSNQIERFIIEKTGIPLEKVFDQYLRSTKIPTLEIKSSLDGVQYRWTNCVSGFRMKVKNSRGHWISPTEEWSSKVIWQADFGDQVFDSLFYIKQSHIRE